MKKVIVIGGGISGLSAACFLAEKGFSVEVIEASPKLGGRAYSFQDKQSGFVLDNGQHIMMGCYKETLSFLKLIGADKNIKFQENLEVNFLSKGRKGFILKASSLPYPFSLLTGILNYRALSITERLSLLRIFLKLLLYSEKDLKKRTVAEWLSEESQSSNSIKSFWEILCIGTLNTSIYKASSLIFVRVLKEVFLKGKKNSLIVLPLSGLSDMYCSDAENFIKSHEGKISISEEVEKVFIRKGRVLSVKTNKREMTDFDYVLSTIPFYSLQKIVPVNEIPFKYSPILSAHFVLRDNPLKEPFYGLIDSPVQWIFNRGTHISIVISSAEKLIDISNEELSSLIIAEIEKYTSIKKENILSCRIIKEKRATFVPSNNIVDKRPAVSTKISNLFIAGDWVETKLPATLEGAVVSARAAVDEML